ncbi:putative dinucleotide-binding enzyme [Streptomyces sp. LBL]|uniref:NADPH-dependent F420 reductase n=1 Tax=Streptomyces sp. LBL TaxID=2940562 RepID=UPI002474E087|nr:NAD(P)-binding domain-containing protein [Streptomyces sp. LBL]MDH6622723.1 putative dinucleotide-binding enzyme [Streptomyces sp. LBL]
MTQTIGFIGSGMIGGALARLAVAAGLNVVMSNSRGPETLADLVAELGEHARAAGREEAAQAGDLVVATVPMSAYDQLPAEALAGRTVIDTLNYYPERDGRIAELDGGDITSSELLQRHLTGSRVVKTLHNMDWIRLYSRARPAGAPDRSALPVAGDDPAAKAEMVRLLDVLGYDAVDIGTLADSWRCEPGTPVYVWPYLGERPEGATKEESQRWFREGPGEPVPADRVKELIDAAVRGPVGGSFAALPFWG